MVDKDESLIDQRLPDSTLQAGSVNWFGYRQDSCEAVFGRKARLFPITSLSTDVRVLALMDEKRLGQQQIR